MVQIDMEMPKVCYKCRFFCVRFCATTPPVEGSERNRGMRHRQFEDGDEVYGLIPKWCPLIHSVQFTNQLRGVWEETVYTVWNGTDENHEAIYRKVPTFKCSNCGKMSPLQRKWMACPNCKAEMSNGRASDE